MTHKLLDILEPQIRLTSEAFHQFIKNCASPSAFRDYLWQTYNYIKFSPATLRNVANSAPDHPLFNFLIEHAKEEDSHAPMLLQDILTLAYLTEPLGNVSPFIELFNATSENVSKADDPVSSILGDTLILECRPMAVGRINNFVDSFGVPRESARTLFAHSVLDEEHARDIFNAIENNQIDQQVLLERAIEVLRLFRDHWKWMNNKHRINRQFSFLESTGSGNNKKFVVPIDNGGAAAVVNKEPNWGYAYLGVNSLWETLGKGKFVKVGIADSGIDLSHPAFTHIKDRVKYRAFDVDTGNEISEEVYDSSWHGTHCAGILCGILPENDDENQGMGVAPDIDTLFVARVMEGFTAGTLAVNNALKWFIEENCDIISLSLGWPGQRDDFAELLKQCAEKGIIVVAAAGNEYGKRFYADGQWTRSPGNYPESVVLSVGAIDRDTLIWRRSGGGIVTWDSDSPFSLASDVLIPQVVAPGVQIVAAGNDGDYQISDGTSMATPHVAGILSLILSKLREGNILATPREALSILKQAIIDQGEPGPDLRYGQGSISVDKIIGLLT